MVVLCQLSYKGKKTTTGHTETSMSSVEQKST